MEILEAGDGDREWAAGLLARSEPWTTLGATLEKCRAACNHPEYRVFVARTDGANCGVLVLHPRGLASSPYVKSIAIAEGYRSRGIGAALMEFAEEFSRRESRHLFLCVSSFNSRAREFYAKHGYRPVGEIEDYVIDGASEIILCKKLR
jgi:[ribosomal protein S18]-alanine N-acetyltransferase